MITPMSESQAFEMPCEHLDTFACYVCYFQRRQHPEAALYELLCSETWEAQ